MYTAFLTKYNGEVEVREALNFQDVADLEASLGGEYLDIEIDDYEDDDLIKSIENPEMIHFI